MIRYVLRDVKSALKGRLSLYYLIGMLILCVSANVAINLFRQFYGLVDGAFGQNLIIFAEGVFIIPYYSTIFIADIIFGKECPNPHIKDKTTIKLHRWQLYIGKLIGSFVLATIFFVVSVIMFFGTTSIFQIGAGTIEMWTYADFLSKALVALPLWIAGLSIGTMSLFLFDSKKKAYIVFFVIVLIIPRIIMLGASDTIRIPVCTFISNNILITPQFTALQFFYTMDQARDIILGVVYTVISCAVGICSYYKRK